MQPAAAQVSERAEHAGDQVENKGKLELVPLEPESDDDEEKKSQASTAPASRRRSARSRRWVPERKVQQETKHFHASLIKALQDERSRTALADIPKTTGLQTDRAETLYRLHRVVHDSPVIQAPKPPLATRKVKDSVSRDGDYDPNRPVCPHRNCKMMENEAHLHRFLHECPHGHSCFKQWDPLHRKFFWHPPTPLTDTGATGWKAEKYRSTCLPEFSAAAYQNVVPLVSNCPRGGFRRQKGTTEPVQLKELRRKDNKLDNVSVAVVGIDRMWSEPEFLSFVKMHTNVYVFGVEIERAHGYTTGTGFVRFGTFEDAQNFIMQLEGKSSGAYLLHLRYRDAVSTPSQPNSSLRPSTTSAPPISDTATVLAFNRMVKSCGPYCEDAAAVVARMQLEGHRPDANTYTLLIRSYAAADPPKPAKAEAVLERMLDDGVRVTASACNAAVAAWCRVGNMKRAEDVVRRMELSKGVARTETDGSEARRLAVPNHETYELLTNGWKGCGLMDDVGELRRGHFFPKEHFPRDHLRRPQTVFNSGCASDQAPSLLSSWARRRSGFAPLHSGQMIPERPPGDRSSGLFVASKWRPLC